MDAEDLGAANVMTLQKRGVGTTNCSLYPEVTVHMIQGDSAHEGYGVMVLNPNENHLEVERPANPTPLPSPEVSDEPAKKRERKDDREGKKKRDFYEKYRNPQKEGETEQIPIRENGSPEEHLLYVWDHFVSNAAARNVFIVAHSYGGLSLVELPTTSGTVSQCDTV
ncbi:cotranscriptional regulator ARB2A homolog [Salvelinus sp. IW2-2015]|uniref:cotranscriptional regulator ARB2A homolog n=1 Tax=Salvelinus sp. IW2-2015 TaxID=2691554 RepID=UPI0038D514BC